MILARSSRAGRYRLSPPFRSHRPSKGEGSRPSAGWWPHGHQGSNNRMGARSSSNPGPQPLKLDNEGSSPSGRTVLLWALRQASPFRLIQGMIVPSRSSLRCATGQATRPSSEQRRAAILTGDQFCKTGAIRPSERESGSHPRAVRNLPLLRDGASGQRPLMRVAWRQHPPSLPDAGRPIG
jgi:hypothetical protein